MSERRFRKNERGSQRGFALLVVVLLVALMSITVASLLDVVNVDQTLNFAGRRSQRAFAIADAALGEVAGSRLLEDRLPRDITAPSSPVQAPGEPNELLNASVVGVLRGTYAGNVTLEKKRKVAENSVNLIEALVYDVDLTGETDSRDAQSRVRGRFERIILSSAGRISGSAATR